MENPFVRVYEKCNTSRDEIPFPRMVDVEATNACNMKCTFCPNGTGRMKREQGFMSPVIAQLLIRELGDHKTPTRFVRWGEPTLWDLLPWAVKRLSEEGCITHVNTNGKKYMRLETLRSKKYSMQGLNPDQYKQARGEDLFTTVLDHARHDMEALRYGALQRQHIAISTTVDPYRDLGNDWIAEFIVRATAVSHKVTIGYTAPEVGAGEEPPAGMEPNRSCTEVFNKLAVNWDGSVSACCRDYDNQMIVGHLENNTLEEIWKGKKMAGWRDRIRDGDYDHPVCKTCYNYIQTEGDRGK